MNNFLPLDSDGVEITPDRILDSYLNTGDYNDALDGWVWWQNGKLCFESDSEDGNQVWQWELKLDE